MQFLHLYTSLFPADTATSDSNELLMDITKKYPYFSLAHFYLLQQTENTNSNYPAIAAKTAIHFNNPFLLNYRLNKVETVAATIENVEVSLPQEIEKADLQIESVKPDPLEEAKQVPTEIIETKVENKVIKPAEEMIFEPLFASDYFASQGIKLSEEVQTGDKLGKQLKSFTEWLKTMKKVHDSKLPGGNEQVDLAVQKLAEKSNQEDDILTESMAEAYLQQGKVKKAREIYEKLSLFNPSKSAYFAAKIESLAMDKQSGQNH